MYWCINNHKQTFSHIYRTLEVTYITSSKHHRKSLGKSLDEGGTGVNTDFLTSNIPKQFQIIIAQVSCQIRVSTKKCGSIYGETNVMKMELESANVKHIMPLKWSSSVNCHYET